MLERFNDIGVTKIRNRLKWTTMVLFLLTSVATAQSVQTINSEPQLASTLCRNLMDGATTELLLDKNSHLVNVTLWNRLLESALSASQQHSPNRSIEIYRLALRVADRIKKPELVATTYYYLGRTYSEMSDFENSIRAYETSRTLFEQGGLESNLIPVLADLGASYLTVDEYEKAQTYSKRSLAIAAQTDPNSTKESPAPIEYGQARALHTLGEIDLRHGNHEEALKKLREALASYERPNGSVSSYNLRMSEVLITLAKVYGDIGKYSDAFSYLTKADQVSKSSGDQLTRANIMSNQAALFLEQEDYATAQKYFDASLAIYQSLNNTREEARVLLRLAVIEQRQGRDDDALMLFERTKDRAIKAKLVDVQIAAGQGLGISLTAKRDFPNALKKIKESLELARRVNAKTREVELLCHAAQTYYAKQDYREAASLAQQALTLSRTLQLPKLTYLASAILGEAYAADETVELAITTLKDAINEAEELRDHVAGGYGGRHLFFENKLGPYRTLVKLLIKQGRNLEALVYAERAKARVLLEAVRNNRIDLKDALTERERLEAERLINNISLISEQIQSTAGTESTDHLKNQMETARRELALFQERVAAAYPELQVRVGTPQPLTLASLNALVPADRFAYFEYVVTENDVGVFILKRNGVSTDHELTYVPLPVNANELRRKVNEFHTVLAERHPDHDRLGRELYRLLIAPAANELKNIRTVCIIPDGFLWTLPFQALTTTRGNYLLEEYSLYYAPSLSVLNEMRLRRPQQTSKESLIAFGNPVIERDYKLRHDLHPIPEAGVEVAAVARAMRTKVKKVLVGPQAEEKSFKALAPQYATIHIATHGLLDNRDPLNSYLVLTKTNSDPENDGLLRGREIMDMRLDSDLAVLSACETGNGRISPGEGVVGMSWAFLVAGARSVVVSQWRVNSSSTSQLMKEFYKALARQKGLNGPNKSQALREASLHLLKDRRYRHPFYWAGFVLVSSN